MARTKLQITGEILEALLSLGGIMPKPGESVHSYLSRRLLGPMPKKTYYNAIWRLADRGAIRVSHVNGVKHLVLTKTGMLEALRNKMQSEQSVKWDGKWRVVIFDIPVEVAGYRDRLRRMLKELGFQKLQASVFVRPYPLPGSAAQYLQESGLSNYVRIMRVDKMDNDAELRRMFKL